MHKFEKLNVWQESLVLIRDCYNLIHKLPKDEEKNLHDQLRRAVVSINLNIAEGTGANNDKEFKRFLEISKKSTYEVLAILKIIEHLYKIETKEIDEKVTSFLKQLNSLIKYLRLK